MDGVADQIQNLSFLTWDTGISILVLVLVFAYAYTIGRDFVATMIVSFYIAAAIVTFAPLVANFPIDVGLDAAWVQLIALAIIFILTLLITTNNGYFEPYIVPSSWEVPVFCLLFAGLVLTVAASYLPAELIDGLSPSTRWLFLQESMATAWMVAPIVALIVIRGKT